MPDDSEYVEVAVMTVGRDVYERPQVVLQDEQERQLHVVIGQCEALAIAQRLDAEFEVTRPLTQDLILNLWKRLGAVPVQLRIDDLWKGIYYSKMTVEREAEYLDIDCRPSDGLALALAAKVPIFVADKVMVRGNSLEPDDEEEEG